jgi:hypothetical protein
MAPGATRAWWESRAALLDVATHPELVPLLGEAACAIVRPDRIVLGAGAVDELTDRVRAALGR